MCCSLINNASPRDDVLDEGEHVRQALACATRTSACYTLPLLQWSVLHLLHFTWERALLDVDKKGIRQAISDIACHPP